MFFSYAVIWVAPKKKKIFLLLVSCSVGHVRVVAATFLVGYCSQIAYPIQRPLNSLWNTGGGDLRNSLENRIKLLLPNNTK